MTETFWLFTDGGATGRPDGTFYGSYAFALFKEVDDEFLLVHFDSGYDKLTTTPRMEFTGGIEGLRSLNNMLSKVEDRCEIYVVMDALNTVESINSWHKNWRKNSKPDGTWMRVDTKTKKMTEVLNQDLLKELIGLVDDIRLNHYIKVLHINSHIERKGFEECYDYFIKKNNMIVTREGFRLLISCNEYVDKLVVETRREKHVD